MGISRNTVGIAAVITGIPAVTIILCDDILFGKQRRIILEILIKTHRHLRQTAGYGI